MDFGPDDIQGQVVETIDDTGLKGNEYMPIDEDDKRKGANSNDLNICPPDMRRAMKLRSAGLTRRRRGVGETDDPDGQGAAKTHEDEARNAIRDGENEGHCL